MTTHHQNGPSDGTRYIDTIDPEDPEYIRQLRRPADVKEDVRGMEDRKRVSLILQSRAFKDELEHIVTEQLKSGSGPANLIALQQLSQLINPSSRSGMPFLAGGGGNIIPIADIRGVESMNYNKIEKIVRCKTAAAYRLIDMFGWSSGLVGHITVRLSQDHEHFLVNPYGLSYSEVTAGTLLKVDMRGEVLDPGSTGMDINRDAFAMHAAIHASRPDIKAIFHLCSPSAVAVSSQVDGLLPISRDAVLVGPASFYDYSGSLSGQGEKDQLARALGPSNKILFLRNHGVVALGANVEEAFYQAFHAMTACETQVRTLIVGVDKVHLIPEHEQRQIYEAAQELPQGWESQEGKRKWHKGELEFEALMRQLDNAGYKTGYLYREPLMKREAKHEKVNADIEIPPASSSLGYMFDDGKPPSGSMKKQVKSGWLTSPNVYRREEFDEIGTPNPKKITKWVPDSQRDAPIRIDSPSQFAPQGANPKELKEKYKEIRKDYFEEKVSAGPQSRHLEGVTWDEAQRMRENQMAGQSDTIIVVGAASKGIIHRDHRHNAVVYQSRYAANPFEGTTEEDIDK